MDIETTVIHVEKEFSNTAIELQLSFAENIQLE